MISILPTLDVMKTITDKNISGDAANERKAAFDEATDLMSIDDFNVVLEGNLYAKVSLRLNDNHKTFFESVYTINNATKGIPEYDIIKSVKWVAESETKTSNVIIISNNPQDYKSSKENLIICSPKEFMLHIQKAKYAHKREEFSSIHDALNAILFFGKQPSCLEKETKKPEEPKEE